MAKRATLRDVAANAGVSISTASRILNGKSLAVPVTAATRERVLRASEQLSYRPNRLARGLADCQTHVLGLSFPITSKLDQVSHTEITYLNFGKQVAGVQMVAQSLGYEVHIFNRLEYHQQDAPPSASMYMELVDGLIYVNSNPSYPNWQHAVDIQLPIVFFGTNPTGAAGHYVSSDDRAELSRIVDAMIRKGHRRIAYLAAEVNEPSTSVMERLGGYRDAHERHALAVDPDLIRLERIPEKPLVQTIMELAALADRPTAMIISRQEVTNEVLMALGEQGIDIPRDLEVLVLGDDALFDFTTPSVSAMRMDYYAMAREAAQLLVSLIEGKQTEPRRVLSPWSLVERESCVLTPYWEMETVAELSLVR
jgi:LacI family transcriptional regulator